MTIFFVTGHDEPTKANLFMARRIGNANDIKLYGTNAIRASLLSILSKRDDLSIFAMSHGRPYAVIDNMSNPAIQESDGPNLVGFKIYAWACWTGATLGHRLARQGVIWWGYDCKVTAPDERVKYADIMSVFFKTAKNMFTGASDQTSVHVVLENIRNECINALNKLDSVGAYADTDAFSLYSCCNQFWERLSVWIDDHPIPYRHPQAPPAYIDL